VFGGGQASSLMHGMRDHEGGEFILRDDLFGEVRALGIESISVLDSSWDIAQKFLLKR